MKAHGCNPATPTWKRIDDRYVVYGEWLYAKHTVFYNALPHYFCEFDVYDRRDGRFLSTPARRSLLTGLPITSAPVLGEGTATTLAALVDHVGPSTCRTARWRSCLAEAARAANADPDRVAAESDADDAMEGLYLKIESGDQVTERLKWVRPTFLTAVLDSGTHWLDRSVIVNRLADPDVLYRSEAR